jgi:hypothetical protein
VVKQVYRGFVVKVVQMEKKETLVYRGFVVKKAFREILVYKALKAYRV